jgi:hypothetical protein
MPARKNPVMEEIPWSEIEEVTKNYPKVSMRIQRRNAKGQLQTLTSSALLEASEVANLEDWLQNFAGGGTYEIEVKDPNGGITVLVPRFKVGLEGPPRPPRFLGNPVDNSDWAVDPYAQQPPPAAPATSRGAPFRAPAPPWSNGLHPQQRTFYGGGRTPPAPGATVASDQLAMQQFSEYKAETSKMIAKLESQVERLLDESKRKDEALAAERERAREERHKSELQRIEQMLQMQMEQRNAPRGDSGNAKWLEALPAFAPVLGTLIQARESSASKSLEVQQQGLMQLMNATLSQANEPGSTSEMLKTVAPLLLPFFKDMMEQKSPAAQAQLFNSMVENNLSQVAMMAQLIEAFASQGEQEPWWLPMIRETLGGVVGMTEAYMQGKGLPGQLPNQQPQRQLSSGAQAPQMQSFAMPPQAGATYSTDEAAPPQMQAAYDGGSVIEVPEEAEEVQPIPSPARARAKAERATTEAMTGIKPGNGIEDTLKAGERMMLGMLPAEFQTPEWRAIVIHVERQEDVEQVAELTAHHLLHMINFNTLPGVLHDLVEDPARALDRLLAPLPVMRKNPDYAIALLNQVIDILVEAEAVVEPPKMAEVEEVEEQEAAPASPATAQAS